MKKEKTKRKSMIGFILIGLLGLVITIVIIISNFNDSKEQEPIGEKFTVEEFESQSVSRGNVWDELLESRAKIVIKVGLCKGAVVSFVGDSDKYCFSVVEVNSIDYPEVGHFADSGWNYTWDNPLEYTSKTFEPGYLIITISHTDNSELEDTEVNTMHSMFKVNGYKYVENNVIEEPGTDVEPEEPKVLKLTVGSFDGASELIIYYEEGMSWGEWVESEYNIIGAAIEELALADTEDYFIINFGEEIGALTSDTFPDVHPNDLIDSSIGYHLILDY